MRKFKDRLLQALVYLSAGIMIVLLAGMIGYVLVRGVPNISWRFLTSVPSVTKNVIGILPFLLNTLYIILLAIAIVLPLGVGAAVYLTEYAKNKRLIAAIEFTTEALAGIPSILYGLFGMLIFCQLLGFGTSLKAGACTLVIMTLPTIIRTTQESLKTVPQRYRDGALGLGATKWRIVRTIVIPGSLDGIVSGCILAIGRIVGESAALLFTAGCAKSLLPNLFTAYNNSGATLSVALYLYAFEQGKFEVAFGIAAVLMILVLLINLAAKFAQKKLRQRGTK
ncbi:MAG: phosphate ABC transporter permease PstA [Oscillospiraceae bacterium]|nr:phosphate ABC transporter permease PstA [Oscillospiraceae bacterium]